MVNMKLLPIISTIFLTTSLSGMEAYDIPSKSLSLVEIPTREREIYRRERRNTIGCTTPTKREMKIFKKNNMCAKSTPIDYRSLSPAHTYSYDRRTLSFTKNYDIEQNITETVNVSSPQQNGKLKLQLALIGLGTTAISATTGLIISLVQCKKP